MIDKNSLRKTFLQKRLQLDFQEFKIRNQLVIQQAAEFLKKGHFSGLHTFLAIAEKKEVDTLTLVELLKTDIPALKIMISKSLPKGELSHYNYDEHLTLAKSKWGIPEPVEGHVADLSAIDVVFVPLISFDKTGHRIGYGKGYYDRFLAKVPRAKKVGLALTPPLDHILFSTELDVKLDACITPFKTYYFD